MGRKRLLAVFLLALASVATTGCGGAVPSSDRPGVEPTYTFPVTDNETPYSRCLRELRTVTEIDGRPLGNGRPVFAIGEITDRTGQYEDEGLSRPLTQGVSEMVYSAMHKTGKAQLVERYDLRIPLAEMALVEQGAVVGRTADSYRIQGSDFVILGAITEMNFNIVSGGVGLNVYGIGGSGRVAIINVAMDLRVVDTTSFRVPYVVSLQKQIRGTEVEADIFRFFGETLVGFEAGGIRNEPLQVGVRSVAEMGVYQIMTDFLGLPVSQECQLVQAGFHRNYLGDISNDNAST